MLKQSLKDKTAAEGKGLDENKAAKAAADEAKETAEGDSSLTVKVHAEAESERS